MLATVTNCASTDVLTTNSHDCASIDVCNIVMNCATKYACNIVTKCAS